jgi:NADH-quinone oxidoreductase subunit E
MPKEASQNMKPLGPGEVSVDEVMLLTDEKTQREKSSSLIPLLQKVQAVHGYLPHKELERLSQELNVPLSRIYGVASFFTQFRFTPLGKYVVKICHGTACHVNGAEQISEVITSKVGVKEGETTNDQQVTLERVACLGCCSLSPVIMVNDKVFGNLDGKKAEKIIDKVGRDEIHD